PGAGHAARFRGPVHHLGRRHPAVWRGRARRAAADPVATGHAGRRGAGSESMTLAQPAPAIDVVDLRKAYPTRDRTGRTLDGVTFAVAPHEFVSVLGPSGCGKTTVLKIVAGLVSASGGMVRVDGRPVSGPQRKIGIVFQVPALMRWRTAF